MNNDLVPLPAAAERMNVPVGTMRRWVRQGCPVAQPGRRGRGHATKVCLRSVTAWRDAQRADERAAAELAAELPAVLAQAAYNQWLRTEGQGHRRAMAGALAGVWAVFAGAAVDHLQERFPGAGIPHMSQRPEAIERLAKIAGND